jgi:galactose mutarotase-like enzyme
MIKLVNDQLEVTITEEGAELQSIRSNGVEYLWQADTAYWAKHSPVLFPIVGELKDGKYIFNNREYKLPRHGFARSKIFTADQTSPQSVMLSLKSDPETLSVYPFQFIFQVEYTIKDTVLFCTYHVENPGVDTMYFSVGGHPAFNVPLIAGLKYTDYFLEFNNNEILEHYLVENGLIADETESIHLINKTLPLKHELFYQDAIVLKHLHSNEITLQTTRDKHGLKFKFDDFPLFGIWAANDAPFVCLEPWCGMADNIQHDYQLIHKEGINKLAANQSWQRTWSVEMF